MQDIFQDVTLTWKGQDYVVPAKDCMRLAYKVELALVQDSGKSAGELLAAPLLTALAYAYAAALRFAGAIVSDDQVYEALARSLVGDVEDGTVMLLTVNSIFDMLLPPSVLAGQKDGSDAGADGAAKKPGGGSSKGSTPPA